MWIQLRSAILVISHICFDAFVDILKTGTDFGFCLPLSVRA
jgi:hypothetical protein